MKKKIAFAAVIAFAAIAFSSCKVHKGCPAYSQADVELVQDKA
ncbi:MAG: hypothetical protein ACJAY8_000577 [Sphingobacteriales bacterium]|jgi:hypothetical protein